MNDIITITHDGHPVEETEIVLPPSKSLLARNMMIRAYSGMPIAAPGEGSCRDLHTLYNALRTVGETSGSVDTVEIDVSDSGTALRFMLPYLALQQGRTFVITGTPRLCQRPVGPLVDTLIAMGAEIEYLRRSGRAPLRITAHPIRRHTIFINPSLSSQFVSALMLMGPVLTEGLDIRLHGEMVSRKYVDMTWNVMRRNGVDLRYPSHHIAIPPVGYRPDQNAEVERDWSAAAFIYEAVSFMPMGTRVLISGLESPSRSIQGDSAVPSIFRKLGVSPGRNRNGMIAPTRAKFIKPEYFKADFNAIPDLVPAVVATLCGLGVDFTLYGLEHLKYKESDRLTVLHNTLMSLGYATEKIEGGISGVATATPKPNIVIDPHGDHRMAMALAPLAMFIPLRMREPQVVDKSFPDYFNQLQRLGYRIS